MQSEAVIQFEALWKSSDSPPDVFTFLAQCEGSDLSAKLAVLLNDQQHRWRTKQPLKVEDYLARVPDLASHADNILMLAIGEFKARQNSEMSLEIDEFTRRFADIGDTLRSKLSALASPTDLTIANPVPIDLHTQSESIGLSETIHVDATVGDAHGGRYRMERLLGEGGFGRVYLAFDEVLRRQVAVKVPTVERLKKRRNAEVYLAEARTVASLDHPNIVPVYDMGRTDDGSVYVVSKFIEGRTLKQLMKESRPTHGEAAKLLSSVAQGLHHAHARRIIHRDVKPGNILIEESTGVAYISDFGLAIREEDYLLDSKIAGTPDYMSPEQARGEGHRLDARSDVYSLGVVLYEMLTGKRPFRGSTTNELLHQAVSVDPLSLRNVDDSIPVELERICLKALSKRASDRYETAAEFANDLLSWRQGPEHGISELQITPKGLRSFDAEDADFFLDLLPGPRSRDGLPAGIHFWKARIEETDPDKTFRIGLIYGPSGCGKSSMVKAGLLPRLAKEVTAIYLEATPNETETRLLRGLRKRVPDLPHDLGLVDTFIWLRRREGQRVVIILDQFEQWLHAHRAEQETSLVNALRQCDGGRLQAVVMVRDDFSMAASRFMRELEARIVEGHNFATVDLFDVDHATKVLMKFGQAFGRLPGQMHQITDDQQKFIHGVASGLAKDGKVVSVRLALFAEMVKGKPWVPGTLDEVGGTEGIGANFLEEMFGSRDANPEHLHHHQAARQVLMALLPEVGSDIKGHMQSHAELLEASRYQDRPGDFNELLRILDGKLRLITPTDPEGFHTESASDRNLKFYQLTHDYLVPSLRDWLTRKQKESRRGRAELTLAERSSLWNAKPERRHLPSWWEWARIKSLTENRNWTPSQRKMMGTAGRVHGARLTVLLTLVVATVLALLYAGKRVNAAKNEALAVGFVTTLSNANIEQVPGVLQELQDYRQWVEPKLMVALANHSLDSNQRLNISLALLPSDASQLDYLLERLLDAEPEQVDTIRSLLRGQKDRLIPILWRVAEQPDSFERKQLLQAVSALAIYDPDNEAKWRGVANHVVETLVNENSLRVAVWIKTLRPARDHLIDSLSNVYRSDAKSRSQTQIDLATDILEDYAEDKPAILGGLLLDGEPKQFLALFDEFASHEAEARFSLDAELDRTLRYDWHDPPLDPSWIDPTAEVVNSIEQSHGMVADRFAFCQTLAIDDFQSVVQSLRQSGYRLTRVRPYADGDSVHVAAAWTRDGLDWRLVMDESSETILAEDERFRGEGYVAVDVAGYVGMQSGAVSDRFAAVWVKKQEEFADARIFAAVLHADVKKVCDGLKESGYEFTQSLQAFRGLDGARKYCGVVLQIENPSTLFLSLSQDALEESEYLDKIAWDIDPSRARAPQSPRARNRLALLAAEKNALRQDNAAEFRFARGKVNFDLGNDQEATDDFDFVINLPELSSDGGPGEDLAPSDVVTEAYRYRAIVHARSGKADQAWQDLAAFNQRSMSESAKACLDAIVAVCIDDDAEAIQRFEDFIEGREQDEEIASLYDAACAYSMMSGIFQQTDVARSKVYADRAVSLIRLAIEFGYTDYSHMSTDPDLDPIRDSRGFLEIMEAGNLGLRYAAVWNSSTWRESLESHGLTLQDHVLRCREMAADGYRIVSIGTASIDGQLVTASVWHRPLIADEERERLARRQANAAVAAMRMGAAEKVWPLLQHRPDSRLRTWIIHRLRPMGASPELVVKRLNEEADHSIRRALILSLGEFADDSQVDQDSLSATLLELYRSDPDAGIHASAEWVLRRWGKLAELAQIDRELATGSKEDEREWISTKQGHTMVVIPGPVGFLMGSPSTERDRSSFEYLHRKQIDHSFAIASKEVTVGQFQEFLRDTKVAHPVRAIQKHAPDEDCPQISVTWYEAAAYCRWLSEQEGLAEDQMCYPPISQIQEGMTLPSDYLSRTGYRLPTEAEWEYACRANSITSRYYGEADELLRHYAWYVDTSDDRTWPVGLLKPNDNGLFDMQGNVQEWCQEAYTDYSRNLGFVSKDREGNLLLDNSVRRLLRGGSFGIHSSEIRSAYRSFNRPMNRYNNSGFRPARTCDRAP